MAAPVASFTGSPTSGNLPIQVVFEDASSNTPTSWLYDFGDGTTSTCQHPVHVYVGTGPYTVAMRATNGDGSNTQTRVGYLSFSDTTHTTSEASEVTAESTVASTYASYMTAADAYYAGTATQAAMLSAKATWEAAVKAEFDLSAKNRSVEIATSPIGVKNGDRHSDAERHANRQKGVLA